MGLREDVLACRRYAELLCQQESARYPGLTPWFGLTTFREQNDNCTNYSTCYPQIRSFSELMVAPGTSPPNPPAQLYVVGADDHTGRRVTICLTFGDRHIEAKSVGEFKNRLRAHYEALLAEGERIRNSQGLT